MGINKKARKDVFDNLGGRAGISERILEIAKEIVAVGSYKRSVIGAGQIRVLAELAEIDTYWDEKMSMGRDYEYRICLGAEKVVFDAWGSPKSRVEIS